MLQQTRAATVAPYFARWTDRFPDVGALARAREEEVLAAWEGLGYYRRARALHRAARYVVQELAGRLPGDEGGWRALPGVGPYTAAAIAALAHGAATVPVDANVRRVGARLLALPAPDAGVLTDSLRRLLPRDRPGRIAEALIELGATVCTPRAPDCPSCPLRPACAAAREGDPRRYPAPRRRAAPRRLRRWALVLLQSRRVWLERRPEEGLLGGMWGFPQSDEPPQGVALERIHHLYSHLELELVPVLVEPATAPAAPVAGGTARWVAGDELAVLPLSKVDRIVLERLARAGLLACWG